MLKKMFSMLLAMSMMLAMLAACNNDPVGDTEDPDGQQQEDLQIKMGDMEDLITSLSGGNQQKVVLAKWLMAGPKVLILDNPTQGVDVGAKEEIYHIIQRLADEGVAIIVLSSEAQEIIRICDRSIILFHGRQSGEVSGDDMTEAGIMYLATGGANATGGASATGGANAETAVSTQESKEEV